MNLFLLIAALATFFAGTDLGLPPEVARAAGVVLGVTNVINLWLRTVTTEPIALARRKPGEAGRHGTGV